MISLFLLFGLATALVIQDCSNGAGTVFVDQLDVDPDPPKPGVDCEAVVQFRVTSYVDTLNCTMTVKKMNIPIYKMALNFCDALGCPIDVGAYNTSATVPIPSYTPTGTYGIEISCLDSSKKQNMCAATNVTIAK